MPVIIFCSLFFFIFIVQQEALAFSELVRAGKEPPECLCQLSNGHYLLITGDKYREYKWVKEEGAFVAIGHRRRLEIAPNPNGSIRIALETSQYRLELVEIEFWNDWLEFNYKLFFQRKKGGKNKPECFEGNGKIQRGGVWEECFDGDVVEKGDYWEKWVLDRRFVFSKIAMTFYYRKGRLVAIKY